MGLVSRLKWVAYKSVEQLVTLNYHHRKVVMAKLRRRKHGLERHILETHEGTLHHEGGKFALFLIWQPKKLAWYVENALNALEKSGVNVIIITNHVLSPEQVEALRGRSHTILVRDNTGYDIGGYQDGTLFLAESGLETNRVLYMNDSVYYFETGLREIFERLATSPADICGTFENWEYFYHVQSFCFSVSGKIFSHSRFQEFWRNYLPVNSRLWAIQQGEIRLSQAMAPVAESIDVIYRANDLRAPLSAVSDLEIVDLSQRFPADLRLKYADVDELKRPALVNEFAKRVYERSQIHTGGLLFRQFLGCPLMKRDLFYRTQFTVDEMEQALRETGHEGHIGEIMTDLRKKGTINHHPTLLKRIQARAGII